MSSQLGHSNGAHGLAPQSTHFMILPDDNDHLETFRPRFISTKLNELLHHTYFDHYSSIIQDLLEAEPQDWDVFVYVRFQSRCSLFRTHHTSIYYNPPPDIFELVDQIRKDKSWTANRQEVITRVGRARRQSGSSWPDSGGSGVGPSQPTHIAAPTGSAPLVAGEDRSLLTPCPRYRRRNSGYQPSSRGSSGAATSPTTTTTDVYVPAVNSSRTAPKHHRFYCPSKFCKKSYPQQGFTRQGHYERHMQMCHHEWQPHDPATSLRKIPISPGGQLEAGNTDEHVDAGMTAEATTPHPPLPPSTPCTPLHSFPEPGSERPTTPSSENILQEILQFGAQTELSRHVQGPFTPALSTNFDGIAQANWEFDIQRQTLHIPSSQTLSNPNQSFYSGDSYMESQ